MKLAGVICGKNDRRIYMAMNSLMPHVDQLYVIESGNKDVWTLVLSALELWGRLSPKAFWEPWLNLPQAKNLAVAIALRDKCDYIAFIDADTVVASDWGNVVRRALVRSPDILIGARYTRLPKKYEDYYIKMQAQEYDNFRSPRTAIMLPTDNTVWRLAVFGKIGAFDTRFRSAGEDVDIGIRALSANLDIEYAPGLTASHEVRSSLLHILRRRWQYLVGGAMAWKKYGRLHERIGVTKMYHPVQFLDMALKPLAVIEAWRRLKHD